MRQAISKFIQLVYSVPVRIKIFGIVVVPILILGLSLNYWVTTGLSDWLSYLIDNDSVVLAMEAGSRSVLLVSILAAIAAILFTFVMMFWLTRPLMELQKTALEVAQGELDSRAEVWSHDEIGMVADSFNLMLDNLVTSQQDLRQTNRQLSLMNKIAQAINQDLDIHDALYKILECILDALNLETGWVYLYDYERESSHLATWKGVGDDEKPTLLEYASSGLCACQQELVSGQLTMELTVRPCARLNQSLPDFDNHHLSIPLSSSEHNFGVIVLRVNQAYDLKPHEVSLLSNVAGQVSEYVSKSWLVMKLDQKEAARQKLMKALITSQESERSRLAQELHDGAGQVLTGLLVRMKALERDLEGREESKKVTALCENTSDVIEYIRHISYKNHPIVLGEFGLKKALENLMDDMIAQAGLQGAVDVDLNNIKLPKEIEATIYRMSQETLTNTLRHADAKNVTLRLWAGAEILHLLVKDDGVGFDVDEHFSSGTDRHLGIITIKDRLELLGGNLEITSLPGEGTELLATLPMLEEVING